MNNQNNINFEVEKKILKNYQEILDAEKNHPENIVTLRNEKEIDAYFNSL